MKLVAWILNVIVISMVAFFFISMLSIDIWMLDVLLYYIKVVADISYYVFFGFGIYIAISLILETLTYIIKKRKRL